MADRPFVGGGSGAYAAGWEETFRHKATLDEHQRKLAEHNVPIRLTSSELSKFPEYSITTPTEVVIGKRWRRNLNAYSQLRIAPEWWLGEYIVGPTPDTHTIIWRPIELVNG
jgi:hypothetical protein